MGYLDRGTWNPERKIHGKGGAFERKQSSFRHAVTADGSSGFPAEPGRYHLFVSLACPWACRAVIVRRLKRLTGVIGMSVVSPDMLENGWTFGGEVEPLTGARHLWEIYVKADPDYSGSVTVPVLWDKERQTIVNNESAEIIRMLDTEFEAFADTSVDLYPKALTAEIDRIADRIYPTLNNGVYRAGFATKQQAYDEAVREVFATLDEMEAHLANRTWLVGDAPTEADVRLFTTLIRFDVVYFAHFKCNRRRIADYPNLSRWLRRFYELDGVAETVDFAQIKRHYYGSQLWVNPTGIVPIGPEVPFGTG
jgi:putative glutathione S-transferase